MPKYELYSSDPEQIKPLLIATAESAAHIISEQKALRDPQCYIVDVCTNLQRHAIRRKYGKDDVIWINAEGEQHPAPADWPANTFDKIKTRKPARTRPRWTFIRGRANR